MKDLLATIDNKINNVTTTQMVTADALIAQAKKDAAVADAAAKIVIDGVGDMETMIYAMMMDGRR